MGYSRTSRGSGVTRHLFRCGIAGLAALSLGAFAIPSAVAQDDEADDEIEEITVTGSRIRRSEFTSASPVQIINMETTTLAGLVDVSDILQSSTVAGNSSQINNMRVGFVNPQGGPGVNTVDLRGLGPSKTLVLMNGRRIAPAGVRGGVSAVDLNVLPASIIQRVEVLKDGASSIYGSDAVAGVVNIITRDDIDGFVGHVQSSTPTDTGGQINSADLAWGFSNDKANMIVGVEWFDREELNVGERAWSECFEENYFDPDTGEDISTIDPTTGEVKCWNSPANDYVVVQTGTFAGRWIRDGAVDCAGATGPCVPGWRIGSLAERKFDNERQANANMISPAQRLNFFSFGNIELDSPFGGGNMTAYYEYLYNSRTSSQNSGPRQFAVRVDQQSAAAQAFSPFYDGTGFVAEIPLLLPYNQVGKQEVNFTRAIGGLTGEFGSGDPWTWDVYYSYGHAHGTYQSTQMLVDRVANMLDVVEVSPGVYDCAVNQDFNALRNFAQGDCVPFNPYAEIGRINNFSPDVLDYMTSTEVGVTNYTQHLVDGYVTGNLFEMPAGTVGAVFGTQYRKEEIEDTPSSGSINGNLWGFTSSGITAGKEDVFELYTELEVPLVRDKTAFQDLTLQLSGRYTDYELAGDDTTYKIGLNWQMIDQFRLRASFGTSFRAPALFENFLGGQTSFSSAGDPCVDWNLEAPTSSLYQNCQAEGVPLDHGGFTSTPQVITFGNAGRLRPETSEALTIGAIVDFDEVGLSFALDYFDFEIVDEISRFGPRSIMNQCYNLPTNLFRQSGTICDFISARDPNTQNISDINDSYFNINAILVNGFDFTARYVFTIQEFDIAADFRATKIETWERELFGGVIDDLNGTIGLPDFNSQFDLRADWRDWTVYYGLDWIGGQEDYTFLEEDPATSIFIRDTDDVFYHSLSVRYRSENWSGQLGMTNLTNEDPPIVSDVNQTISDTGAAFYSGYDLRGQTVFVNVSMEF